MWAETFDAYAVWHFRSISNTYKRKTLFSCAPLSTLLPEYLYVWKQMIVHLPFSSQLLDASCTDGNIRSCIVRSPLNFCTKTELFRKLKPTNSTPTQLRRQNKFYNLVKPTFRPPCASLHRSAEYFKTMSAKVAPERVEIEAGQEMAATTIAKSSVSVDVERIEAGAGEEMAAITEVKSSVSTDVEKSEEVSGKDNMPASKSPVSMDEEEMDLNIESTTVDYFDNRPIKKAKSSKTCVSDDPLSSFTISTASIVSECSDSVSSELMNEDPLPPSPNQLALSPVSTEDDKHITNNLTYEYLPQDYTLTQLDECAHCVIQYSNEDDVLVKIGDISIRKRYLECLLARV
nr:uncharacterized protein LOC127319212 isoform X3 [Lolium perenne]